MASPVGLTATPLRGRHAKQQLQPSRTGRALVQVKVLAHPVAVVDKVHTPVPEVKYYPMASHHGCLPRDGATFHNSARQSEHLKPGPIQRWRFIFRDPWNNYKAVPMKGKP